MKIIKTTHYRNHESDYTLFEGNEVTKMLLIHFEGL